VAGCAVADNIMAIKAVASIVILFIVGNILVQSYIIFPIFANFGILFAVFLAKKRFK
jgi:hypothetical protein